MLMLDHVKCKWQKIWQLWLFSVNKFVAFHHYRLVQIQTAFPFMKPESNQCLPFSLKDWHLYSVDFVHEALPTYLNVVDLEFLNSWYQYWGKRWLSGDSCRLALIWQWHCLVTVVSIGSSSTLALPLNFRVRCDFWQYSFKCSNWAIDS